MRIFTNSAVEIAVLGVAFLLLILWTNYLTRHLRSSLHQLTEQGDPHQEEAAKDTAHRV